VEICQATGRTYDSYLNVCKERVVVVPDMKLQKAFNRAAGRMAMQRLPCCRILDQSGVAIEANFNMNGDVSPLLAVFDRETLSRLKKIIGYDILQTFPSDALYFSMPHRYGPGWTDGSTSDPDKDTKWTNAVQVLLEHFEAIGVRDAVLEEICILNDKHETWFDLVFRGNAFPGEDKVSVGKEWMMDRMVQFAARCKLNFDCLDVTP
jgi:hypothetical protein